METRELSTDLMRTLVQHSAWHELMQAYLLPQFQVLDVAVRSTDKGEFRGALDAITRIIEAPYVASGYKSPLERRYQSDQDLVSTGKKRAYKRKEKEELLNDFDPPARTSYAV